ARLRRPHPALSRLRAAHESPAAPARFHHSPPQAGERAAAPQTAAAALHPRHERRVGIGGVSHRDPLILVSSNPNKGIEAERIIGMPLLRVSVALPEIQAAT